MKYSQIRLTLIFIICSVFYFFLFIQSQGLEGGQDSWNHFIISKYALKYPNLLIDQWNKPVFTWATVLVSQLGYKYLILYNLVLVLLSSVLIFKILQRINVNMAEFSMPILLFMPIVLGNSVSCLTEPLNMFWLSIILYFWVSEKYKTALILASFLPFIRTEGFVILGALFIHLLIKKEFKILPFIFIGSVILNIVGYLITGKIFWIITENPYLRFELDNSFDPGSGSIFHYIKQMDKIFGLIGVFGLLLSLFFYKKYSKNQKDLFWLNWLIVFMYVLAHSLIYYLGILGSHGIVRVMMVVSPSVVILAFLGISKAMDLVPKKLNFPLFFWIIISTVSLIIGYKKNKYSFPFQTNAISIKPDLHNLEFEEAGIWIEKNNDINKRIIHQSPFFNVRFNKDPYDSKQTYYNWSILKEKDWTERGSILIWDNFYSVREGGLPLDWLLKNSNYKLIKEFNSNIENTLQIKIFEKIK